MGGYDEYKPAMAMFALQFSYAGVALSTRAALLQGMSPTVFVVYRQAIATLVIAPLAYFTRRKSGGPSMGLRSFTLIFLASLIGVAINQNIYFQGLYLASSSMASAMANLVPAVTFLIASILGLEKVNIRSLRSLAKIVGTILCVSGAMSMALLKGPKLLNAELQNLPSNSFFGSGNSTDDWILGCIFLFGSCCCWSIWLILQVPASASYPDHLSLSAWMCFMATIQSAIITLFLEKDLEAWKFSTGLELGCCFFSGIVGSGVSFFVQAWCISERGPLFSAMFNPLCTVIVTILAAIFLQEKIYTGGLVGGIGVIIGLYILLWGKAKDIKVVIEEETDPNLQNSTQERKQIDDVLEKGSYQVDLKEPLLSNQSS
ncbi:WAT1-related protein At4g30420-like [Humulus lupulus]|uniref:WAT1-related protein At4g30420-like n=1 Tax=Humulus lupulus TaxID=3486 RepID=UPI002B401461|nr:WAT1-related protein At4g30420-like [Humulus lupulus]XP_062078541.1 WAT1-related protein At4g30420-like [Humulus lupulus]